MARAQPIRLLFPGGGLNRRLAYQSQRPFTTADALNVRLRDSLEDRDRGGSRPGIRRVLQQPDLAALGGGARVQLLSQVRELVPTEGAQWVDNFDEDDLSSAWSLSPWATVLPVLDTRDGWLEDPDSAYGDERAITRGALIGLNASDKQYSIKVSAQQVGGVNQFDVRLYAKMNDSTPDYRADGIQVILNRSIPTATTTLTVHKIIAGVSTLVATANWLSGSDSLIELFLDYQDTANRTYILVDGIARFDQTFALGAGAGDRMGVGLISAGIDYFQVNYTSTSGTRAKNRIVAASNGQLYLEDNVGQVNEISDYTSSITLNGEVDLMGAEIGGKLYIADYDPSYQFGNDGAVTDSGSADTFDNAASPDWTTLFPAGDEVSYRMFLSGGTPAPIADDNYAITTFGASAITLGAVVSANQANVTYNINRVPKFLDPASGGTLSPVVASSGVVPLGCRLVARFLSRLFWAGQNSHPNLWYASAIDDPLDYDYANLSLSGAVAASSSDQFVIGEPITAMIPMGNDYMIFGCVGAIYILRGDPKSLGRYDAASRDVGIVGPWAWCRTPRLEVIVLSDDGLYVISNSAGSLPVPFSRRKIPQELRNLNTETHAISMAYDVEAEGFHVFVTPRDKGQKSHWFVDWRQSAIADGVLTGFGMWPATTPDDIDPFMAVRYKANSAPDVAVVLGCRDGRLRRFDPSASDDDGTTITSYVLYGPIALGGDEFEGLITEIDATLDRQSGDIQYAVMTGDSAEEAKNDPKVTVIGTWGPGANSREHQRARGHTGYLLLSGTGLPWAIEMVRMHRRRSGSRRIL